jgi:hypothetical protein
VVTFLSALVIKYKVFVSLPKPLYFAISNVNYRDLDVT